MSCALIVIDMLNRYDFEDADKLVASVEQQLPTMARLVERAREDDVTTIYVNDSFGAWHYDRSELVDHAKEGGHPELIEPIEPAPDTAFLLKARHSIFYQTPLEYLLRQEEIDKLILIGQVTEQCVLYSALDAYIRHFTVHVPPDAVAHIHEHLAEAALEMMRANMGADLTPATEIDLSG
jgi:nicotinamidase-related amidase